MGGSLLSTKVHPLHGAVAEGTLTSGNPYREVWCAMCPAWSEVPAGVSSSEFLDGHCVVEHGQVPWVA